MFDEKSLERVRAKLRSAELLDLTDYWVGLRSDRGMPRREDIDTGHLERHWPRLLLVDVGQNPLRFTLRVVGTELEDMVARRMTGEIVTDETPMFFKPYAACAGHVRATHEFLSFDFGDGTNPGSFERLLLPLSDDGEAVDGILGEAVYTNLKTDPSQLM